VSPAFLSLYPKDSEPREISQREIYSQVSAIAAYRFAQIKALTGVLNLCFASLRVKFDFFVGDDVLGIPFKTQEIFKRRQLLDEF
jgi:hypothetical protein